MTEKRKRIIDPRYAKSEEYSQVLRDIVKDGKCPFCFENFAEFSRSKHTPMKETAGWYLVRNSWPYPNTEHHLLIIPKRHCEELSDLTSSDMVQILELAEYARNYFSIKGGAMTVRFGDSLYTGATVVHLHFHLIVPEIDGEAGKAKTVQFPIG